MLPCRPFFYSAVTSARASSTSARTSVETCVVASRTSSPIDWSLGSRTGSGASGIDGRTGGTSAPPELVGLATAVLLGRSGFGDLGHPSTAAGPVPLRSTGVPHPIRRWLGRRPRRRPRCPAPALGHGGSASRLRSPTPRPKPAGPRLSPSRAGL